jgi:hypothetical protein
MRTSAIQGLEMGKPSARVERLSCKRTSGIGKAVNQGACLYLTRFCMVHAQVACMPQRREPNSRQHGSRAMISLKAKTTHLVGLRL